jgi:hypothetical protein
VTIVEIRAQDRLVRCANSRCDRRDRIYLARPQSEGPFWVWPRLVCECGLEPMIVNIAEAS